MEVVERRADCATCPLLERTDSLTLDGVLRTICFLGTKCSSPPAVVTIAADDPPVVTAESTIVTAGSMVATVESLSIEPLQLWL